MIAVALTLSLIAARPAASGATQYWDLNGNGTWGTAAANWSASPTGGGDAVWTSTNDAVFGTSNVTSTGTLTITTTAISANSITITGSTPYTFTNGATLTLGIGNQPTGTYGAQWFTMNPGAGPVIFNGAIAQAGNGNTVNQTGTFSNNSSNPVTFNGSIANGVGTGSLNIAVTGTGTGGVTFNGAIQNNGNNIAGRSTLLTVNTTGAGVGAVTTLGGGSSNIYNGGTTVTSGILSFAASNSLGASGGVLGAGALSFGAAGQMNFNGYNQSVGALSGAAGSVILNGSNGSNVTFTIGANNNGGGTFAGVIEDNAGGGATGTVALTKIGTAAITLSGSDTFSGAVNVYGGTLTLNGASGALANVGSLRVNGGTFNLGDATAGNGVAIRINPAATLTLGGTNALSTTTDSATFNVIRGSTVANSGSFTSLTVGIGSNTITNTNTTGAVPTINFSGANPYIRNLGGFVAATSGANLVTNFTNAPGGTGNVAGGLIVGLLVNANDFTIAQAGNLSQVAYTNDGFAAANNTLVTKNDDQSGTPGVTINSLRFNSGAFTVTLAGTNVINSGGVMVGNAATGVETISGGAIETGSAGGDLWIYTNGHALTINSNIVDNGASTLSIGGNSTVTLGGTTSYGGATYVASGATLAVPSTASLSSPGTLNVSLGGILSLAGATVASPVASLGTITQASGLSNISGNISAANTVTLTSGTLVFSGSNNYGGATSVTGGGTLQALATTGNSANGNSYALSPNSVLTLNGGTLQLVSDTNTVFSVAAGSSMTGNETIFAGPASTGSNNIIALNNFNTINGSLTLTVTGSNGDVLKLGAITDGNGNGGMGPINVTTGATLLLTSLSTNSTNNYAGVFGGAGNGGNLTVTGALSSHDATHNLSMTFNTTGLVTLDGANSTGPTADATGGIFLSSGTLVLNNATPFTLNTSGPFALGNTSASAASATLLLGGTNTPNAFGIVTNPTGGVTFNNRQIIAEPNDTGALTIGGLNTSGTDSLAYSNGPTIVTGTGNVGKSITIIETTGGTLSITGSIAAAGTDTTAGVTFGDLTGAHNGTVVLGGSNGYAGPSSVLSGVLQLNGGGLAGTAVTVGTGAGNATLQVSSNYTIGTSGNGSVNLTGTTGALSLANGAVNTLTIADSTAGATGLTLGGGNTLNFEVASAGADAINLTGAGSLIAATGTSTINLTILSHPAVSGSVNLIADNGGGISAGNFVLSYIAGAGYSFSLGTPTANALVLTELVNPAVSGSLFFTGNIDNVWGSGNLSTSNWSTTSNGLTDPGQSPGSTTDVHFYATSSTGANLATSLGAQNYTIRTLTVDGSALDSSLYPVSISSTGAALTVTPASATAGITVGAGGQLAISAPLILGAAQTWTNSNILTVNGGLTGAAFLLSFSGTGATTISGTAAVTTSGGFTDNAGAGPVTISAPVSLGASQTWTSNNIASPLTVGGNVSFAANNLTTAGSGAVIISGNIGGTGYVYASGPGETLTLTGTNSFSGGLFIGNVTTPSTVAITSSANVGSGTITFGLQAGSNGLGILSIGGTSTVTLANAINFNNTGAAGVIFTGTQALVATGAVTYTSGGTPPITFNDLAGSIFSGNTWGLNTITGKTTTFNGAGNLVINDTITNGIGSTTSSLQYTGSAVMTLGGNNTYTGLTTLNNAAGALVISGSNSGGGGVTLTAGRLVINNANALGAAGGTLTLTSGTIDNTSGAAIANAIANPISLAGNFGYGTAAGTGSNSLNLGSGAVANSGNRTITLNGAGVLTFGGVMTNTAGAANTLTVNAGTGTTAASAVNFGGYALSNNATGYLDIIQGSGNVNITGPVTNGGTATTGTLEKAGSGTLTLSASNSYSGGTLMTTNGGNLVITNAYALGTGVAYNQATNSGTTAGVFQLALAVTGSGVGSSVGSPNVIANAFTFNSQNLLTLGGFADIENVSGFNKLTGNQTLIGTGGAGPNFVSDAGNLELGGTLTSIIAGTRSFDFGGAGNGVVSGPILSGSATTMPVQKDGTGTWSLTGQNTFDGQVSVNNGTLSINSVAAGANPQSLGVGSAVKLGVANSSSGILQYTGSGGTLDKNVTAQGNGGDTILNSGGGVLTLSGSLVKNGVILTLSNANAGSSITVSGTISGASAGSDLVITAGTTTLAAVNTYNGPTYVQGGGTLVNGNPAGALPATTGLFVGGTNNSAGTFDLGGNAQTVATLNSRGNGSGAIITNNGSGAAALTVTNGGAFAGVIQNGANPTALNVNGGTLTLSGNNTYTGATTAGAGGSLIVSGSISGSTAVTVAAGATLEVDGYVNNSGTAAINGTLLGTGSMGAIGSVGGTIEPGLSTGSVATGTLLSVGDVSLDGTSTLAIRLGVVNASGTDGDVLANTGAVSLGGTLSLTLGSTFANAVAGSAFYNIIVGGAAPTGFFANATPTSGIGQLTVSGAVFNVVYGSDGTNDGLAGVGNDVTLQLVSVPEPGVWAMFSGGAGMLMILRRRRGLPQRG